MKFRFAYNWALLLLASFVVDYVTTMGSVSSTLSEISANATDHFRELCMGIFHLDGPLRSVQEIKDMLDQAFFLTFNPFVQIEEYAVYKEALRQYRSLANQSNCSVADLELRNEIQVHSENHPSVRQYALYYNDEQFEICAKRLNDYVQSHVKYGFELTKNVAKVVKSIRQSQLDEDDLIGISSDFDLRTISRALCNHLKHDLQIDIDKPANVSMNDQIDKFNSILNAVIVQECASATPKFAQELQLYIQLTIQRPQLRGEFSSRVAQFFDELFICQVLVNTHKDVYPLGMYTIDDLTDKLFATEARLIESGVEFRLDPEKTRDLLDIAIRVGQSELTIGIENPPLMRHIIDLATVSQIDSVKCRTEYFKILLDLRARDRGYPNLSNYINHFGRMQVKECIPNLDAEIMQKTSDMNRAECDPAKINELTKVFIEIARQVDSQTKLYRKVPIKILKIALIKYMHDNGLKLTENFDLTDQADFERFKSTNKTPFEICDKFEEILDATAEKFESMAQFDTEPDSLFNQVILGIMTNYKICQTIVDLPYAIRLVGNEPGQSSSM